MIEKTLERIACALEQLVEQQSTPATTPASAPAEEPTSTPPAEAAPADVAEKPKPKRGRGRPKKDPPAAKAEPKTEAPKSEPEPEAPKAPDVDYSDSMVFKSAAANVAKTSALPGVTAMKLLKDYINEQDYLSMDEIDVDDRAAFIADVQAYFDGLNVDEVPIDPIDLPL